MSEENKEQAELLETIKSETKGQIEEGLKGFATKTEIEAIQKAIDESKDGEQIEKISEGLQGLTDRLKSLEEKGGSKAVKGLANFLEEKTGDIKDLHEKKIGNFSIPVDVKSISVGSNLLPSPTGVPFIPVDYVSEIARTPDVRERFNILNYVMVGRTPSQVVTWMEEKSETGVAAFIDECVAKPEVSKDWERNEVKVRKVADFANVCDEVLLYLPQMQEEIRRFVDKLVYVTIQDQILNGDGVGQNLLGITPQATAFVAGTKASSVPQANFADAIRACASQINCLGFSANFAFVNCDDLFLFESIKDANGQYLRAPLGGVTLIDCPFITPGEFLVGDMSMSNVKFFQDVMSEWGRNGEDFRNNAVSVRSEAFLAHYIASNHVGAFIFDTLATVVAAINQP